MTEKRFKYSLLLILCVVFVIVIIKPIELYPDSEGYLNMDIFRSAGYSIFLWVLRSISGSYLDILTIITQLIIGLSAIYVFITQLKKYVILNPLWYLLLSIIISTPYVYNHHLANSFMSEALTYPLYLLVTVFFLEYLLAGKIKKLWFTLPFLFVLILTRSQFIFMVPIFIFMITWMAIKEKSLNKRVGILIAFLVLPIATSLADKTYHQLKHGYFVNTPWTGIHIITPAFYVADEEDYQLYDSEKEQQFFKWIYAKLYHNHLNVNNLNEDGAYNETGFYINHFSDIANATIYDSGKELMGITLNEDQKFIALDELTKKMALPLVLDNFGLWFKLYVKNSISAFGNAKYASIYIILLLFGFIGLLKKGSIDYKVITLLTLLTLGNVALVALGMHTIKRFTFYNDWVLFLILFILIDSYKTYRNSSI